MSRVPLKTYLGVVYVMALLFLLLFLALLQYRWTGEASLAEQQRMRAVLNETLSFIERSFDREFSRAVLGFWHSPQVLTAPLSEDWRGRLSRTIAEDRERWTAASPHPQLIQHVRVAEMQGDDSLLWQYDPINKSLGVVPWPDELQEFREVMRRHAQNALTEEDVRFWSDREGRFLFPFRTIPSIPAVVGPAAIELVGSTTKDVTHGFRESIRLSIIVCLDREYLIRNVLAGLASVHLATNGELQYEYLVRERERPQQVLFALPEKYQDELAGDPDASVTLLQLRLEELTDQEKLRQLGLVLKEKIRSAPGGAGGGGRPVPSREGEGSVERLQTGIPAGSPSDALLNPAAGEVHQEEVERLKVEPRQIESLRWVMEIQAAKGWQLMVRHRAGSLQAAVAQVRTRNLLVSMGILLVLATSLVVFAVAVRQARRLARQQVEFVASISHELRTPVTAICSLSENLADGLVRPEEQVQRYGQFMLREGRRLGSLVEQALEFAGVSSGRRRNRMQLLPVALVLREALQTCEASLQDAKSQVKMMIEPELPQIQADAESLRCALQNLITNAIKYSPGGSTISIQASYCRERRRLEIEVADEGMGIPKDELSRIFEPFYRGRIAVDMQIRGAGIGLSLVKRIVEAHQGRVEISSREGKGTRVTVSLPVPETDVPHGDAVEKGH